MEQDELKELENQELLLLLLDVFPH